MVPTHLVRLLLVALSVLSAAQALKLGIAHIGVPVGALSKREPLPQETNDSAQPNEVTTDQSEPATTNDNSATPTPTTSTTAETTTTPTQTQDPPPTEGTTNEAPTPPDTTTTRTPTEPEAETQPAASEPSPSVTTPTTITSTLIQTITNDDGQLTTQTSVTTSTGVPSLTGDGGNGQTGMSTGTRNTIIGVVVGVGGAIIVAAIAFAAWRIRGRRRKSEENDGLIGYGGYTAGAAEKPESYSRAGSGSTGPTPFQSTLENYHAPTQVNQASNF